MARPTKSGMDYFPHDCDASSDEKLEALQSLYGNDGYAFFFKLCERIYHSENAELDISDRETVQVLCRKHLMISSERFAEILTTALKWGCFDKEAYEQRKVLTSRGIQKRASVVFERRKGMQERYDKLKQQKAQETGQGVSAAETGEETGISGEFHFTRESKVKERKEKEIVNISLSGDKGVMGEKGSFCRFSADEINDETRKVAGPVWSRVLGELRGQMSKANYGTWLRKSEGLICRDDVFVIGVPSTFIADYLNHNLRSLVEKTIIDVTLSKYDVTFFVERNQIN